MAQQSTTVEVKILDKEYLVACPEEEQEALLLSLIHISEPTRPY